MEQLWCVQIWFAQKSAVHVNTIVSTRNISAKAKTIFLFIESPPKYEIYYHFHYRIFEFDCQINDNKKKNKKYSNNKFTQMCLKQI